MGTVSSRFCQCNSDCLHVKCCGIARCDDRSADRKDAYVRDNFYSNTSADDPEPYPESHCVNAAACRPNSQRCNNVNDLTSRNYDSTKCCSYFPHQNGEPLVQSPRLPSSFSVSCYHDNCYRNQLGNVCRSKARPFPSVEALSAGLNNRKSFSPPAGNLVSMNPTGAENLPCNVNREANDREKIPNNLCETRTIHNPYPTHHETYCYSTCSSEINRSKMNSNHESYVLSASSQNDMEEWVRVIKRVILSPFGGGIFGQRLDETVRYDGQTKSRGKRSSTKFVRGVPIIVQNCVEFIRSRLKEEGLFRLPGQTNAVRDFQDAYDSGERPTFPKSTDVHTVTSLLKGYLRELPEPVIPFDQYESLIEAAKLSRSNGGREANVNDDGEEKSREETIRLMIKKQINLIPQVNFNLLKYLCSFLDEVQQHSNKNKMDIFNLAMVFGPNIMRSKLDDAITMMSDSNNVQHIMYQFIKDHVYLFSKENALSSEYNGEAPANDDVYANADAGIGTLTTTASPRGTLGLRHANDDSGTGSLAPTPENTQKRTSPTQGIPTSTGKTTKPIKPHKPERLKALHSSLNGRNVMSPSDETENRKSYYDNVTNSSVPDDGCGADSDERLYENGNWRESRSTNEHTRDSSSVSTEQASFYVNNRSTPSTETFQSSTHAVAGSDDRPSSPRSTSTTENFFDLRSRPLPRMPRRPKPARRGFENNSDEESNTESVIVDDRAISTVSSHRSSYQNNIDSGDVSAYPRTKSYALLKHTLHSRHSSSSLKESKRHSAGSGSDGGSSVSSLPVAPARTHRRLKKDEIYQPNHLDNFAPPGSTRSSNITSIGTSASSRSLTYKEMEEQLKALKEELNKQRLEHEKRSRMLEEHYIIKIRGSSSGMTSVNSPDLFSASGPTHHFPSFSSIRESDQMISLDSPGFRGANDDTNSELHDHSLYRTTSGLSRTVSVESQAEIRYRDEVKRHAITKIRLRNAERSVKQAEERNEQLQKEMENFFETFGSMLPQCSS